MKIKNTEYEVKEQRMLEDVHAEGIHLIHKKSGARICVMSNDDENKVFFIGFRTPPNDSTGVPHIIEHSVLCGSRKFPLKDPFIELVKGSLNTFLNAMTFPDKTLYPVASCNDKDFQNLMDVYLDSVFYPNIYKNQNIFKQEGWHYEYSKEDGQINLNGVVYNEMKGAFSSADGVLAREILRSLFPDTAYQNESGGDPAVIPDLTYEQFLDFHRTYYHPSNSYIYLYGNMDVEQQLEWLDKEYLSAFSMIELDSEIGQQDEFEEPIEKELYYSISSAEKEEDNTYLSCNWAVGNNLDPKQYIAFGILDYALLSAQGAPIQKALLDAGIGHDIYGGYDNGTFQPVFSVIAKQANHEDKERFMNIIQETLEKQVEQGLNKKTLLAAINSSEFKFREADFGRYPKGLMFGLQVMDSWLYDDEAPFLHMDEIQIYDYLRNNLESGYFENLVQKWLLDNKHKSAVTVLPKKNLNAENEAELIGKLEQYKNAMSEEQKQALDQETREFEAYEETPSTQEELETIPLLTRNDMKKESDPYSNEEISLDGMKLLWHDYPTNGIVYLDFLFDASHIEEGRVPYLAILKMLLTKLDTAEYAYPDFADEVNLYTGGIHTEINSYSLTDSQDDYTAQFEVRISVLEANLKKALMLSESMVARTDFSDDKRIYEILAQSRSRLRMELSENGHRISANRAMANFSLSAKYSELTQGIEFYRILDHLVSEFDTEKENLRAILSGLTAQIFQKCNLTISCTCDKEALAETKRESSSFISCLFADSAHHVQTVKPLEKQNEGFMDASQIQYVSLAGNFAHASYEYTGALRIFKSIMSFEYLWNNVRVKGGAYGCAGQVSRNKDVFFTSYRDPNLSATLQVYRDVVSYLKGFEADEREMTKYVIGTFSEMDAPLNPKSQGRRSLIAYLTGTSYETIQKERDEVLSAGTKDIQNLSEIIKAALEKSYVCVIGNEEKLKQEEQVFDKLEHL